RGEVNNRAQIAKRIFRWAASEELVPASVDHGLATVKHLERGRTAAKDPEPIGPVDDALVDATLPHLNRHVRGLVALGRLTGCRPGEACKVRMSDIDTTGAVWLYKPLKHKTAWRGKSRVIAVGPKAQKLLREFRTDDPDDYLFSPARGMAEIRAERF